MTSQKNGWYRTRRQYVALQSAASTQNGFIVPNNGALLNVCIYSVYYFEGVDTTLKKLREPPLDEEQFRDMMKACLEGIIVVLERQYKKYFECEITEQLRKETESARSHNIDAEEIMGMFSATKKKSPNATLCYISCKMRALL